MDNSRYTVIITNIGQFELIEKNILPVLEQIEDIEKIIIIHCNKYSYSNLKTNKENIQQIQGWNDYEIYGSSLKFKIALDESITTESIMFIDENIIINKKICKTLFSGWSNDQSLIHGTNYISINYNVYKSKYELIKDTEPHIVLTNFCMISRNIISKTYNYVLENNIIFEKSEPKYAGIDICASIIAACSNKTKQRVNISYTHKSSKTEYIDWTEPVYSDICTMCIKDYFNKNKTLLLNTKSLYEELLVVIPFFNFASYNQLCTNIDDMVYKLNEQHLNIIVMEAVLTGKLSQLYTLPCTVITTETDTIAFHKEGLFNKAFHLYKDYYSIFVLSDADIIFEDEFWPQRAIKLVQKGVDIFQPYRTCHWTRKDGSIEQTKLSYSSFRSESTPNGLHIKKRIPVNKENYHPGFVWAFSKKFLLKTGGLFSKCFSGGGDIITCHLAEGLPLEKNGWSQFDYLQPELNKFLIKGCGNLGSMEGVIFHLHHGQRHNRQYHNRHVNILKAKLNIGPEFFSQDVKDHLITAIHPCVNKITLEYFKSRNEDE